MLILSLPHIGEGVYIALYILYIITILGTILVKITENRNPVKS